MTEKTNAIDLLPVIGTGDEFAIRADALSFLAASWAEIATAHNIDIASKERAAHTTFETIDRMNGERVKSARAAVSALEGYNFTLYTSTARRAGHTLRVASAKAALNSAIEAQNDARNENAFRHSFGKMPVDPLRKLLDMAMFGRRVKVVTGSREYDALVMVIRKVTERAAEHAAQEAAQAKAETAKEAA